MQVANILEHKGDRVITTRPDARVSEVSGILRQERIGAALVRENGGELIGIISERDIVHAVAEHGAASLDMVVSDLMTSPVITCDPERATEDLMDEMLRSRIRHLPVVQDGALLGIVSIGDVVSNVVEELKWIKGALQQQVATSAAWATDED